MSSSPDPSELPPLLVPTPRRIELGPGRGCADPVQDFDRRDLDHGAYRLSITANGARIEAASRVGRRLARATLRQLRRQYGDAPPRLTVQDWPALERRGYMLDISRDRVPTEEHLGFVADLAGQLKLNELELYTEHTYAYAGHEEVWAAADPVAKRDLRAAFKGGEPRLVLNQNCFGHFERWLKHPRYASLAETHDEFEFEGILLRGPFSLCPTDPRSLQLVRDLLRQLLGDLHPLAVRGRGAPAVNIGCDETQDVGQGRSAAAVTERGAFAVYAEFVNQIASIVAEHGFEPRLWADIALREPARISELHPDLVPIAWGYEPDHPFDEQARTLAASGRPFHLACGSSAWRSFTGRTTERRGNLEGCLKAAVEHGARGVLLTEWGDVGHRQVHALGRLALAEFASRAWNPEAEPDDRAISLHVFGDRSLRAADWIAELGNADLALRRVSGVPMADGGQTPLRNASALFEELHPSGFPFRLPAAAEPWREVAERLAALAERRPEVSPRLDRELDFALLCARFAADLATTRRSSVRDGDRVRLRSALAAIRTAQRGVWLADSRPGGLEDSLRHWDTLHKSALV